MTVRFIAGNGYKQIAGLGLSGIIADTGDLQIQRSRGFQDLDSLQQFKKLHVIRSF